MKYLPKSIIGALVAALYLLLVGYFLFGFVFGSGGPHGEAGASFIYAFVLTLPLSAIVISILDDVKSPQQNSLLSYLVIVVGLAVCAFVNAGMIYLVVKIVSRALQALFSKPAKPLK